MHWRLGLQVGWLCVLLAPVSAGGEPSRRGISLEVGPLVMGRKTELKVLGAPPDSTIVYMVSARKPARGECRAKVGEACLDLSEATELGRVVVDQLGTAVLRMHVPNDAEVKLAFQAVLLSPAAVSPLVVIELVNPKLDSDQDGLKDVVEYTRETDPNNPDSDGDGLSDGDEIRKHSTDPLVADSDGDGLNDGMEVRRYRTDPARVDTDGDGANDGREVQAGTDPLTVDYDGDGIPDGVDLEPMRPGPYDAFRQVDLSVSDPTLSLPDPEFDPIQHRIVWHSMSGHEMWVADIDPQTGDFVPDDGKGVLVDVDVAPIIAGANGPEWVFGDGGAQVSFVVEDGADYVLWHGVQKGPDTWITEEMPGGRTVGTTPYGSDNPLDERRRVTFNRGGREDPSSGWREVEDGSTATVLPPTLGTIDARWVADGARMMTGTAPVGPYGWRQIWLYDIDTGEYSFLTDDPTHKYDSFIWRAPEYDDAWVMLAARGDVEDEYTEIVFYLEQDGVWRELNVVSMPFGYPYVVSPEPFLHDGRSYVSFLASTGGRNFDNGVATVWIASVDPDLSLVRRVSDAAVLVRKDPESYTAGARPWVYYAEVRKDRKRVIHRCELGLGPSR